MLPKVVPAVLSDGEFHELIQQALWQLYQQRLQVAAAVSSHMLVTVDKNSRAS